MNYPYTTLYFDTKRAKERLTRLFQPGPEQHADSLLSPITRSAPVANDQREGADRPQQSKESVASLEA